MQELEKILEEIDEQKHKCLSGEYEPAYEAGALNMANVIKDIVRKHMNDGWIPVEERLPETNADGMSEDVLVSFEESNYIIIAFYNSAERRWNIHGPGPYIGRVIAWRPLPEPYRPERSEGE